MALAAGIGALSSATLMVVLFGLGFSVDRLYFGTDTRAQSLLLGSFLGAVGAHRRTGLRHRAGPLGGHRPSAAALVGARTARTGVPRLGLACPPGDQPLPLPRGVPPGGGGRRFGHRDRGDRARLGPGPGLSTGALVFVGRISYGLYLYHWPLFLAIDHAHTGLLGAPLLAVRLAATFAVAIASYYLVEEPIRSGRLFRGVRGLAVTATAALATTAVLVVATVLPLEPAGAAPSLDRPAKPVPHLSAVTASSAATPIRFLLVGDSVALTMGMGLGVDVAQRYDVDFLDEGALGCDLDSVPVNLSGAVVPPTPGCLDWWSTWSTWESEFHPDVVGILVGRWEVSDHLDNGQWVHVGDPGWDAHLAAELNTAIDIFAAGGSKVVLFTMPYVSPLQEAANGTPFSENDPARARAFNAVLAGVARHRHGVATLVDVNHMLDPSGHFQAAVDGIPARLADGIHISVPGGEWLQPRILPTVVTLGHTARAKATQLAADGTNVTRRSS